MDQPIAITDLKGTTHFYDVVAEDCPRCGGVDELRFNCDYCLGLGRTSTVREIPVVTHISRENLRNALIGFAVLFILGASLLAWKMGWL